MNKKMKKKSFIRTGAVVPFIVFTTLVVLFGIFLLDGTIKSTAELVLEKINGAEVNISDVNTNFKNLSIEISEIAITNKEKPSFNKLNIEKISFNVLWDALLRGKFVIELAEIKGILLNKKRTYPGKVFPQEIDHDSGNNKVVQDSLKKAEKEFEGNVFGDVASVLAGGSTGDVSKDVVSNLQSKKRFEALSGEIELAKQELNQELKKLPSSGDLKNLESRFKKIRWKDLGNILKAPGVLKDADKLNKDINHALDSYKNAGKLAESKVSNLNKSYKEAEALISSDLNAVGKRMNLPTLDQASIGKMIFGPEVLDKVKQAKKYQGMLQEYMPPKKEKKPVATKPVRSKGRNYHFGRPNSYPIFWLKLANITSQNEQGKIEGKAFNITNDQTAIGKLTDITVKGDFPPLSIRDVQGQITIDHRKELIASLNGSVGSFIVKDKALSRSKDVTFALKQSSVHSKMSGKITGKNIDINLKNDFDNIVYDVEAKSKEVDAVLKDVAKKTKVLTLNAHASGAWENIRFDVNSNLAKAIEDSVRSLVQEKIEATRRKIKNEIDGQIKAARSSVDKQMADLKSQYEKQMAQAQKQLDNIKSQIKTEESKAKKSLKKSFKGIKL